MRPFKLACLVASLSLWLVYTMSNGTQRRCVPEVAVGRTLAADYVRAWNQWWRAAHHHPLPNRSEWHVLPGRTEGVALTWAPGRAAKPRSVQAEEPNVTLHFDPSRFHFGRARADEWLLFLGRGGAAECLPPLSPGDALLANKFPLGPLSGLIVPRHHLQQPQLLTLPAIELGMSVAGAVAAHERIAVGYNSLGAGASVNHLHFQLWMPPRPLLAEEVILGLPSKLGRHHGRTWSVPPDASPSPTGLLAWRVQDDGVASEVMRCARFLAQRRLPHNLFITERHIALFPRKACALEHRGNSITPGFPEAAGWVLSRAPGSEPDRGSRAAPRRHIFMAIAPPQQPLPPTKPQLPARAGAFGRRQRSRPTLRPRGRGCDPHRTATAVCARRSYFRHAEQVLRVIIGAHCSALSALTAATSSEIDMGCAPVENGSAPPGPARATLAGMASPLRRLTSRASSD